MDVDQFRVFQARLIRRANQAERQAEELGHHLEAFHGACAEQSRYIASLEGQRADLMGLIDVFAGRLKRILTPEQIEQLREGL